MNRQRTSDFGMSSFIINLSVCLGDSIEGENIQKRTPKAKYVGDIESLKSKCYEAREFFLVFFMFVLCEYLTVH